MVSIFPIKLWLIQWHNLIKSEIKNLGYLTMSPVLFLQRNILHTYDGKEIFTTLDIYILPMANLDIILVQCLISQMRKLRSSIIETCQNHPERMCHCHNMDTNLLSYIQKFFSLINTLTFILLLRKQESGDWIQERNRFGSCQEREDKSWRCCPFWRKLKEEGGVKINAVLSNCTNIIHTHTHTYMSVIYQSQVCLWE